MTGRDTWQSSGSADLTLWTHLEHNHLLYGVSQPSKVHLLLCVVARMKKSDLHAGLQFCSHKATIWISAAQIIPPLTAASLQILLHEQVGTGWLYFMVLIRVQTNLFPRPTVELVNQLARLNMLRCYGLAHYWKPNVWFPCFCRNYKKMAMYSTATHCVF